MIGKKSLVHGAGLNDASYPIRSRPAGNKHCHYYQVWADMLMRCYSEKYQQRQPTYVGCSVCDDWLTFSKFKAWMEKQDWQGKFLDKDLLVNGNKIYSPKTCVFVSRMVNNFLLDRASYSGDFPTGVDFKSDNGKFRARCNNPFSKKSEHLGYFECKNKAHEAWKNRKHDLACQIAGLQPDNRVSAALKNRFKPDEKSSI